MLERFVWVAGPKQDDPYIQMYKASEDWNRIYKFISRQAYWHVTSQRAWKAIRESGSIKANVDYRFHSKWAEQSVRYSYAGIHQCVALFDFHSPTEEDVIALAAPVLKHRMALGYAARADGQTLDGVIATLIEGLAERAAA